MRRLNFELYRAHGESRNSHQGMGRRVVVPRILHGPGQAGPLFIVDVSDIGPNLKYVRKVMSGGFKCGLEVFKGPYNLLGEGELLHDPIRFRSPLAGGENQLMRRSGQYEKRGGSRSGPGGGSSMGLMNLCAMFHSGSDFIYQRLRQLVRFRSCRRTCQGTCRSISSLPVCSGLDDRGPGARLRYCGADVAIMMIARPWSCPSHRRTIQARARHRGDASSPARSRR